VGPQQVLTSAYGAVTGRVTAIAIDPADTTGNTVYVGATGGGVWKSANAAAGAASVLFVPVTDDAATSTIGIGSLSIGALTVQPGGTGVVLAGTGDPNDALDSFYGSGILRSIDHGATWNTVNGANILDTTAAHSYSFYGEGFTGFAWSTANPQLVVAAATQAYDGTAVDAVQPYSADGLYYSLDAGATWKMSTLTDGPGLIFQSSTVTQGNASGNAVTAVVWNPFRQSFYAAIRYHGYYSSPDGITWTRLPNQPGTQMSTSLCPEFSGQPGSISCPVFRGALAVQPVTGDMFAFTVDGNLVDQGIWQDVCAAVGNSCSTNAAVLFGTQIPDVALEDGYGDVSQGDYNLWLAAIPSNADTLLYAGTVDIFKRSLAASNVPWRNATNINTCGAAMVAPAQHAIASAGSSLMYFGNDGGLWRTTDGIAQQPSACSADDAAHFENLNGSLGSLAEVTSVAQAPGNAGTLLIGLGLNGTAGTGTQQAQWPQVLDGLGGYVAIDPANAANWFMTSGPGVSIDYCGAGAACNPGAIPFLPTVGDAQTDNDGEYMGEPAVFMLDPQDSTKMLVATCRLWRGSVAGGAANWGQGNAISPVLGDAVEPDCSQGEGQVQSIAASGTIAGSTTGQEILYAGMEGTPREGGVLPYGGLVAGHVFTATVATEQTGPAVWTDLFASPVVNDQSDRAQFNPGGFSVSALVVDPHDTSGQTVYATIQGFSETQLGEPTVYRSTNQGQSWTNITANLPASPVNGLVVDPGDANTVYLATDAGVYATTAVLSCSTGAEECWSVYGTGLPAAPVTTLTTNGATDSNLLVAGTYGRGVYEILLASYVASQGAPGTSMSLTPAALAFGVVQEGLVSPAQMVTVANTGTAALLLGTLTTSGNFAITADSCSGLTLAAATTCALGVTFTPLAQGALAGSLIVPGNVPTGAATAALSGVGFAFLLNPDQLAFTSVSVGETSEPQQITIQNTGSTPVGIATVSVAGDFVEQDTCSGVTIGAGAGCVVNVSFAPAADGTRNGLLTVTGTVPGSQATAALVGGGSFPGKLYVAALPINFGSVDIGVTSAPQYVSVSNVGGTALTLSPATVTSTSGDYIVQGNSCTATLAAGAECTVGIVFLPTKSGVDDGSFSISAGGSAASEQLNGVGLAPATDGLSPTSLTFGIQTVGTVSAPQLVTLTNTGDQPLTLVSATSSSADFLVQGCVVVVAHASCVIGVDFAPTSAGARTGTLTITDSLHGVGSGLSVALSGNGAAPTGTASIEPATLNFGSEGLPLTPPLVPSQSVTLTNNGSVAISGLVLAATGDYAVAASTCTGTLGVGGTCSASVTFTPTATGPRTGTLTATGTNLGQGLTTTLTGIGLNFTMSVSSPASVTVVTGTMANYQVSLAPVGDSSGLLALSCTSVPALPTGVTCTVNPVSVQLTAGATASAEVSIVTPALATTSSVAEHWRPAGWVLACLLPVAFSRRKRTMLTGVLLFFGMAGGLVGMSGLGGCGVTASGGGSKSGGTGTTGGTGPGSTYAVTVTATAPGIQQSTGVTLVLEQ
jgi:hypothetical protein